MSAPAAPSPAPSLARSVTIQPGSGFFATFRALWPYLWPAERADLRARVVELQGTTGSSPAIDRKKGFENALAGQR